MNNYPPGLIIDTQLQIDPKTNAYTIISILPDVINNYAMCRMPINNLSPPEY